MVYVPMLPTIHLIFKVEFLVDEDDKNDIELNNKTYKHVFSIVYRRK